MRDAAGQELPLLGDAGYLAFRVGQCRRRLLGVGLRRAQRRGRRLLRVGRPGRLPAGRLPAGRLAGGGRAATWLSRRRGTAGLGRHRRGIERNGQRGRQVDLPDAGVGQRLGQPAGLNRAAGGGVSKHGLERRPHLAEHRRAGWLTELPGQLSGDWHQLADGLTALAGQFPEPVAGQRPLRFGQRPADLVQVSHLLGRPARELIHQPGARCGPGKLLDGSRQLALAGRADLACALVSRRGEFGRREPVELVGNLRDGDARHSP